MNNLSRILLLFGLLVYVASPLDFVLGPIDDMILMIMYFASGRKQVIEAK